MADASLRGLHLAVARRNAHQYAAERDGRESGVAARAVDQVEQALGGRIDGSGGSRTGGRSALEPLAIDFAAQQAELDAKGFRVLRVVLEAIALEVLDRVRAPIGR